MTDNADVKTPKPDDFPETTETNAEKEYKAGGARPKIPTAKDAAKHKAGGGNVKISRPKIPTAKEAAKHKAGGGNVKIFSANVSPKLPRARIPAMADPPNPAAPSADDSTVD